MLGDRIGDVSDGAIVFIRQDNHDDMLARIAHLEGCDEAGSRRARISNEASGFQIAAAENV